MADEIFQEKDGKAIRLDRISQAQIKTPSGYIMSQSFFPAMYGVSPRDSWAEDPEAHQEDSPKDNDFPKPRHDLPLVAFPADTNAWIERPLLSLGEFPESHGVIPGPDEKVGYDPLRGQLHFFAPDEGRLHLLYVSFLSPEYYSKNISISGTGRDELCVSIQSGQSGKISYSKEMNEPPGSLEAEVILGENDSMIDAILEMRHGSPENSLGTNVLLWNGSPTLVGGSMTKGEPGASWSVQAEVLRKKEDR